MEAEQEFLGKSAPITRRILDTGLLGDTPPVCAEWCLAFFMVYPLPWATRVSTRDGHCQGPLIARRAVSHLLGATMKHPDPSYEDEGAVPTKEKSDGLRTCPCNTSFEINLR